MTGYRILTIDAMIEALGEDALRDILSGYCCPIDEDIEDFLRSKAVQFSKQGIAKTHLVFAGYRGKAVLVGYFTLANKTLFIPEKAKMSKTLRRRIAKFGTYIPETKTRTLSAPLIAQLGKNYADGLDSLIRGDELLKMACDRIAETQLVLGGKVAYLECRDHPSLIRFYNENGFYEFDRRKDNDGSLLVQMIRYF